MSRFFKFHPFSLFISLVAALSGFIYGFNTSIISGALLILSSDFQLTTFEQEILVSSLLVSAMIGAFLGGVIADAWGRRKSLFLTVILFLIGSFCLSDAVGFYTLLLGRLILGLAVGIVSVVAPLYIAEMSPPKSRGTLVSLNQLLVTIGILDAFAVAFIYAETAHGWRQMFFLGIFPAILQGISLFFIPETPTWLVSQGRADLAEKVLSRIGFALKHKKDHVQGHKGWKELFNPAVRKPFLIGIGVSVFQQITGINAVIYYAPQIFQGAGYNTVQGAIFASILISLVNVGMTAVSLFIIDRVGRRPLMIVGLIGMAISLALIGASFWGGSEKFEMAALGGLMI